MKNILRILTYLLILQYLLPRCANPGRPSGGPKDSLPPKLVSSIPELGQKNVDDQTITLEFSEYVNADKIRQQLIITPRTDITYKSIVKRNRLIIKLSEPLQDSTTYNFNFAAGVTDITEKNPALNLALAFSTGPSIDSMSVSGKVEDLLDQVPLPEYLVGLYPYTDTLDYFIEKPLYFTTTSDSGTFNLSYIKTGTYKILSFEDANNNQILDPLEESHAFKEGIINLDSQVVIQHPLRALLQNVKPIEIVNVRPTGLYIEAKANKFISKYSIQPDNFYHQITGPNSDIIRIFKPDTIAYSDSLQLTIQVEDSLGNTASNTTKTTFTSSNRKPKALSITKSPNSISWTDTLRFTALFNKPIMHHISDSAWIQLDSVRTIQVPLVATWNEDKTTVDFTTTLKPDTILNQLAQMLPRDTIREDTTEAYTLLPVDPSRLLDEFPLQLRLQDQSFISVESDTSKQILWPIERRELTKGGTLNISLQTENTSFTFQLLKQDQPLYEQTNKKKFQLQNVPPGKYKIRVHIDTNNDQKWSYGNLVLDQEPEQLYLFPEEISVRENWVNEFTIEF